MRSDILEAHTSERTVQSNIPVPVYNSRGELRDVGAGNFVLGSVQHKRQRSRNELEFGVDMNSGRLLVVLGIYSLWNTRFSFDLEDEIDCIKMCLCILNFTNTSCTEDGILSNHNFKGEESYTSHLQNVLLNPFPPSDAVQKQKKSV